MAEFVYVLCAISSAFCAFLLARGYGGTKNRLLFWSAAGFGCFALTNLILFLDLAVFPHLDLSLIRHCTNLAGVCLLLYGMIWEAM